MAAFRAAESGSSPGARSLELIGLRGKDFGVLYVYGPGKSDVSQLFNRLGFLREYARTKFPDAEIHETILDGFFEVVEEDSERPMSNVQRRIGCKATV